MIFHGHEQAMTTQTDVELMDAWRSRRDRNAMDVLIRRHIDFVYATARRQTGDADLAQDVTQAVFMLMLQKAPRIPCAAALAVWLHRTTGFTACNARRMELRRIRRERLALTEASVMSGHEENSSNELRQELDAAMGLLSPTDRASVILSHLHRCTYSEVAAMIGSTEEATRKRVTRAIERLRQYYQGRGIVVSAAAVATALATESAVTAPAALVSATTNVSFLSQLAMISATAGGAGIASEIPGTPVAMMKAVMHAMFMTKLKLAAAVCIVITCGGVLVTSAVESNLFAAQQQSSQPDNRNAAADASGIDVSDSTHVDFLGTSKTPATKGSWLATNGAPLADDPSGPFRGKRFSQSNSYDHVLAVHVQGIEPGSYDVKIPQATTKPLLYDLTPTDTDAYLLAGFNAPPAATSIDVELLLADGDWETLFTVDHHPGEPVAQQTTPRGGVAITHFTETPEGRAMCYVTHEFRDGQIEVFVIDSDGKEHGTYTEDGGDVGHFQTIRCTFAVPVEKVSAVTVKVRGFNRRVVAKDISLRESRHTTPQIAAGDAKEK
jgi:RNA polymerase sigma factor (sigma-70 family)